MENLFLGPWQLALIFFFVALLYSAVGLAGGSAYTALLAIFGLHFKAIPLISLSLNLGVSTLGIYNYFRHGHGRLSLVIPFLITSIPMSYVGGALDLPSTIFYWVLLVSLVVVVFRIYFWKRTALNIQLKKWQQIVLSLFFGSILGLVSGIAGIGGGIYLIPIIILFRLGTEKEAAACGILFIWLNSAAGLTARFQYNFIDVTRFWPLILAVLAGGWIGSHLGSTKLKPKVMEKLLGIIIVVAILLLLRKLIPGFLEFAWYEKAWLQLTS
jgi:uncharacterized membrane protein YfcA